MHDDLIDSLDPCGFARSRGLRVGVGTDLRDGIVRRRAVARATRPDTPRTTLRSAGPAVWAIPQRFASLVDELRSAVAAGMVRPADPNDGYPSRPVEFDWPPGRLSPAGTAASSASTWVVALVYELLDAHQDTARIFDESASDQTWEAHLDYLRALQRRARQLLASSGSTT